MFLRGGVLKKVGNRRHLRTAAGTSEYLKPQTQRLKWIIPWLVTQFSSSTLCPLHPLQPTRKILGPRRGLSSLFDSVTAICETKLSYIFNRLWSCWWAGIGSILSSFFVPHLGTKQPRLGHWLNTIWWPLRQRKWPLPSPPGTGPLSDLNINVT